MTFFLTFLVLIAIIVLVGSALRAAEIFGTKKRAAHRPLRPSADVVQSHGTANRPAAVGIAAGTGLAVLGTSLALADDFWEGTTGRSTLSEDDLLTNPIYSHLPGNIHHSILNDDSLSGIDSSPDYIHDPIYSYMPQNIYYRDDLIDSGSSISSFDDSLSSSTSSFDDDLTSSSGDWGGGSSFNDW
jgi:hypothetical protein